MPFWALSQYVICFVLFFLSPKPNKPGPVICLFPSPTFLKVHFMFFNTVIHYLHSGFTLKMPSNLTQQFVKYWYKSSF